MSLCWALSRETSSIIFQVLSKTWPRIIPTTLRSVGHLNDEKKFFCYRFLHAEVRIYYILEVSELEIGWDEFFCIFRMILQDQRQPRYSRYNLQIKLNEMKFIKISRSPVFRQVHLEYIPMFVNCIQHVHVTSKPLSKRNRSITQTSEYA